MPCSFEKPVTRIYKLLSLSLQPLQARRFPLRQQRLESDAEGCCCATVAAGAGATPAAFYLGLCRLHGILSPPAPNDFAAGGLFFVVATTAAGGTIPLCGNEKQNRTRNLVAATAAACEPFFTATTIVLHRFASLALKSRIDARKRG